MNDIETYIEKYIFTIKMFREYLVEIYGDKNFLQEKNEGRILKEGEVNDKIIKSYSFHGSGCVVRTKSNEVIDFEFDLFSTKLITSTWNVYEFLISKGLCLSLGEVNDVMKNIDDFDWLIIREGL